MKEKELVEIIYKKHEKLLLNTKETAEEIGISYSTLSKVFTKKIILIWKILKEKKCYLHGKRKGREEFGE